MFESVKADKDQRLMIVRKSCIHRRTMKLLPRRFILCLVLWVIGEFICLLLSYPESFKPDSSKQPRRSASRNILNLLTWALGKNKRPNMTEPSTIKWSKHNFIPKTSEKYFKLRSTKVNKLQSVFIIENRDFCLQTTPFILVAVPSIPTHINARKAIRETYGSYIPNNNSSELTSRVLFFFGRGANSEIDKRLKEEYKKYGDIVQADFKDSYKNLTIKMMVVLKWTATYCGEIDYLLKTDEDVFVNIPLLISNLSQTSYGLQGLVIGNQNNGATVRRKGKWGVSRTQFPFPTYPTYASGNSYVISGNIVPRMFMVSEYIPFMPIEDVFVTGILANIIGAVHIPMEGFTFWHEQALQPCDFVRKKRISANNVDSDLMRKLWESVNHPYKHCKA